MCFAMRLASWRGPDMSLLEFLRKSNDKGDIIRWVKQQHVRTKTE